MAIHPRPAPKRLPAGTRVRVTGNSNDNNYTVGKVYVLTDEYNPGGAVRARDPDSGETGNWLAPDDFVIVHTIGWSWLETVLPKADLELLSAFDGLHALALKDEIKDAILAQLDDLGEAIPRHHRALAPRRAP